MKHVYKNGYGNLELETVGEERPIRGLHSRDVDPDLFFSIDDAEKIALISENRQLQIIFPTGNLRQAFVVRHASPDRVTLCRVTKLETKPGLNATREIEEQRHTTPRIGFGMGM